MSLLTTLRGDIPGLLWPGSVLRHNRRRAVALQVIEGFVLVAHHASGTDEETEVEGGTVPWDLVALDLSDPTGRVHAAWWCRRRHYNQPWTDYNQPWTDEEYSVVGAARAADDMTPEQIDLLARLVLRLAGRTA